MLKERVRQHDHAAVKALVNGGPGMWEPPVDNVTVYDPALSESASSSSRPRTMTNSTGSTVTITSEEIDPDLESKRRELAQEVTDIKQQLTDKRCTKEAKEANWHNFDLADLVSEVVKSHHDPFYEHNYFIDDMQLHHWLNRETAHLNLPTNEFIELKLSLREYIDTDQQALELSNTLLEKEDELDYLEGLLTRPAFC